MFQKFISVFHKKAVGVSTPAALPLFGLAPTLTGKTVTTESAMRVPAVACAVALIAETVGALPAKLFDKEGRESITDHAAYRLIHDEANPWTSAESLRVQLTTDALLSEILAHEATLQACCMTHLAFC